MDRPDREKIAELYWDTLRQTDYVPEEYKGWQYKNLWDGDFKAACQNFGNNILALFPDNGQKIEEAEKQRDITWIKALMRGGIMVSEPKELEGIGERIRLEERGHIAHQIEEAKVRGLEAGKALQGAKILRLLETFGINDRTYPAMWEALKEGVE